MNASSMSVKPITKNHNMQIDVQVLQEHKLHITHEKNCFKH